ncbi:unnamed protein product [Cylindrotheca closterium]|uniref:Uncharacterized protein n=1 Tax=Cylindrotheca closterium TaxID=2856 RepID=A0AAD2G2F1_9STRA|nr:unnamed protein product [Cylindrotheca closterium]
MTNHAIHGKQWNGVWAILASQYCADKNERPRKRSRRRILHELQPLSTVPLEPKIQVQDYFISLCQRTEDAHMALEALLNSDQTPLSVEKLRRILDQGILINRRSQSGRTFLHECCTADYVDARVVHRCVQELLTRYQADPNILTTGETDGDRPAIFFSISRLMPSVTAALIQAGANSKVQVTGTFRLVSNPAETFSGTFTPVEFARRLKEEEGRLEAEKIAKPLSQYWRNRLRNLIATLSET